MKKDKKSNLFLYIFVALCLVASGVIYSFSRQDNIIENDTEKNDDLAIVQISENGTMEDNGDVTPSPVPFIYVHVCGYVEVPGVVRIFKTGRVIDAVEAAGGFSTGADTDYINQAKVLADGERIYIPSREETATLTSDNRISGTGLLTGDYQEGGNDTAAVKIVNINRASADELTSLPGIGSSRARDIIEYRTKVGPFVKTEDIMNVSGIGTAMYEKIKAFICV